MKIAQLTSVRDSCNNFSRQPPSPQLANRHCELVTREPYRSQVAKMSVRTLPKSYCLENVAAANPRTSSSLSTPGRCCRPSSTTKSRSD